MRNLRWPDQQHRAQHEQRGVLSGRNDFVLDPAHPRGRRTRNTQPFRGRRQQPRGVVGGKLVQPVAGISRGLISAEQPGERTVGGAGNVVITHLRQVETRDGLISSIETFDCYEPF